MLLLLAACTGKDPAVDDSSVSEDPTETLGECAEDTDCGDDEICEDGVCVQGDRDNTEGGANLLAWGVPAEGWINPAGDVDWYAIEATGGEYLRASVALDIPREEFDTVLTIRGPDGATLTRADAHATGATVADVDAVAFAYLAEPGTYTFTVEDIGTATNREPYGHPEYGYELLVERWEVVTVEPDAVGAPSVELGLDDDREWYTAGFLLGETADTDWIWVDHVRDGTNLWVDGNEDLSGSDADGLVRLWNEAGELLGEKASFGPSYALFYPRLAAGRYLVELTDAEGAGGADHWGFAHLLVREDTVGEVYDQEAEPNQTPEEATTLVTEGYKNSDAKPYLKSLGQGTLDASDDLDVFALTTEFPTGGIVVCLVASAYGSLTDPILELLDEEGHVLASDTGSAEFPNANLDHTEVTPGTWYVRVRPPLDAEVGPGAWYRFAAYAASFTVSPYEEGGYGCP